MLTTLINRFIYRPDLTGAPDDLTPAHLSLDFEDVAIRTADGLTIAGWYLPASQPRHALLYLHGNGGDRRDWVAVAPRFVAEGISLFLIDYRGYGKSEGHPTEEGLYLDGEAAWDWLKARSHQEGVSASLLGKSLGSGVATRLAVKSPPASLILDSAFTSMHELIALHAPWLPKPLIPQMYASIDRVARITCPTLVIHGDKDELVPLNHAVRIYRALQAPKVFGLIKGAGHNNIDAFNRYYYWAVDFLHDPLNFIAARQAEPDLFDPGSCAMLE